MSFTLAVFVSTVCILSLGFVIASVVPTARFAQPVVTFMLYPMLGTIGVVFPIGALPPTLQGVAASLPLTYAVALLRGIWRGEGWVRIWPMSRSGADVAVCIVVSAKVFRWE